MKFGIIANSAPKTTWNKSKMAKSFFECINQYPAHSVHAIIPVYYQVTLPTCNNAPIQAAIHAVMHLELWIVSLMALVYWYIGSRKNRLTNENFFTCLDNSLNHFCSTSRTGFKA